MNIFGLASLAVGAGVQENARYAKENGMAVESEVGSQLTICGGRDVRRPRRCEASKAKPIVWLGWLGWQGRQGK